MPRLRRLVRAVGVIIACACAACATVTCLQVTGAAGRLEAGQRVITVGSFGFPESVLLAWLRGQGLVAHRGEGS